jgi:predicted extracellular nuclease
MARRSLATVSLFALVASAASASTAACGSSSHGASPGTGSDAGNDSSNVGPEGGAEGGGDSGGTMTIAQARAAGSGTVTVVGIVTAVHGATGDQPVWYIEDPAGGPNSGIAIYCDPDYTTCSKSITAPAVNTEVQITGAVSTYMGQMQIAPTAQTVVNASATPPAAAMVTMADLAPGGSSTYRGVYVKVMASKLTVDSVTPAALYDTQCQSAGADGGDAGSMPSCTGCSPPTYSGFRANDGSGNEVYIENYFFNSEPLQSSPECLTQSGAVDVTVGTTFSAMAGVLDYDGYASAQDLMPVQASDYTTP